MYCACVGGGGGGNGGAIFAIDACMLTQFSERTHILFHNK